MSRGQYLWECTKIAFAELFTPDVRRFIMIAAGMLTGFVLWVYVLFTAVDYLTDTVGVTPIDAIGIVSAVVIVICVAAIVIGKIVTVCNRRNIEG